MKNYDVTTVGTFFYMLGEMQDNKDTSSPGLDFLKTHCRLNLLISSFNHNM